MHFYITGRQTGKTESMLEWFLADWRNRAILVMDTREQDRVVSLAAAKMRSEQMPVSKMTVEELKKHILPPVHAMEVLKRTTWKVGIDNVENILQLLYGNVVFVTATGTK